MNRLQKKCLITSAGFHLLLVVILLVGPAFLSSKSKPDNLPVIDFVPSRLVDASVVGGGNPNARPPEPAPLPPQPRPPQTLPQSERTAQTEPLKQPAKPNPAALESKAPSNNRKPLISTQLVARPRGTTPSKQPTQADTQAREDAKHIAQEFGKAADAIRNNSAPSTTMELFGPGGGGATYASYDAWIRTVYMQAWIEPEGVSGDVAMPKASITIARDGTVISARIIQASGAPVVDRAVQATLERVKFIAPFPEGSKDEQRTYTIKFDLQAKRLL